MGGRAVGVLKMTVFDSRIFDDQVSRRRIVKRSWPFSERCSIADDDRVIADWPLPPARRGSKMKGPAGATEAGHHRRTAPRGASKVGNHEKEYQWPS